LMWRSAMGLEQTPTQKLLSDFRKELNDGFMHCPVGLQTLYIPKGDSPQIQRSSSQYASVRFPWVYLTCGHVHGPHEWKADQKETNEHRTCPVCRKVGPFVRLSIGEERGYCLDTKPPTHAFVPCGHMCSESTARYWSSVSLPHSLDVWGPVCPFCKAPVSNGDGKEPYIKLIFS
jgi:pellino protein